MSLNENKVVAVDGPSASGKSTVSKGVARDLGWIYVDSGSLYRGVTWNALRKGTNPKDTNAVIRTMEESEWKFFIKEGAAQFSVDGVIPSDELRSKEVRESVSDVAVIPEVRDFVNRQLRALKNFGSLVMEGRDIGTVVFPDTPYKFYLDASPKERAMRRYRELLAKGETEKAHEVMDSLQRRDRQDSLRKTAPLQIAEGAVVINNTNMSIDEVVNKITTAVKERL